MLYEKVEVTLPFRAHLFRIHGDKTVRILLVETTSAQAVYEGFGPWSKCRRWIKRLAPSGVSKDELAIVRKLLDRKQLATIRNVRASVHDLEALGFHRADS